MKMTVTEICQRFCCTRYKVDLYILSHRLSPCGFTTRGSQKNVRQYELTPEMENYLRTSIKEEANRDAEKEAKRIADGWLTLNEIAKKWECSYMKTLDILVTSHAEWEWEGGRKLWKIPEKLSRNPSVHLSHSRPKKNDFVNTLPPDDGDKVKAMVLDEQRGRALIGKKVVVRTVTGNEIIGRLEHYNMIWFSVEIGGTIEEFKHNEAKVLKETE